MEKQKQQKESIKIGYDSTTGLFLIPTTKITHIDNIPIREFQSNYLVNNIVPGYIVTDTSPLSLSRKSTRRSVTKYVHSEELEDLPKEVSKEGYQEMLREASNLVEPNDDGEFTFKKTADAIYYNLLQSIYEPISEETSELHKIEFEIIQHPVSEYEEIVPFASSDLEYIGTTQCKYVSNKKKFLQLICKDYANINSIDIPNHSGIRYVKINKEYIKWGNEKFPSIETVYIGSYKKCKEAREKDFARIRTAVEDVLFEQDKNLLSVQSLGKVYKHLQSLQKRINELDTYKKAETSQRAILSFNRAFIEQLKKRVENE